jgi:hypothetical protein
VSLRGPLLALAAVLAVTAGCTVDAPSMIPIDVTATLSLSQVSVDVEQAGRVIEAGTYDWMPDSHGVLKVAVLLPPEISGEVVVNIAGTTVKNQTPDTQTSSHPVAVTPGQVAATVRIVLLPR